MRRLILVWALAQLAAPAPAPAQRPPACGAEIVERWNRFARDANAYVTGLNNGVVDARMRGKLDREWKAVTGLECW